jgi:hypothetical protein
MKQLHPCAMQALEPRACSRACAENVGSIPTRHGGMTLIALALWLHLLGGCTALAPRGATIDANPPAIAFDHQDSDPRAIAIADASMQAMGGRKAWNQTRYLTWSFFGRRLHVWDRHTGDIRVEWDDSKTNSHSIVLMNIHTRDGRAWRNGNEVTDKTELSALLKRAHAAWVNDSYWLVMPYKLKDSGVTLGYVGQAAMEDGRSAEVLSLTFRNVGLTPANKYHVYIATDTKLVEQWAFYAKATDTEPAFVGPWHNWQQYGRIMLSDDHGQGRAHTDVAAPEHMPGEVFTQP